MSFDPWHSQASGQPHTDGEFKPADEDVIRTLAEIEKAYSGSPSATSNTPIGPGTTGPAFLLRVPPVIFIAAPLSAGASPLVSRGGAVAGLKFVRKRLVVSSGRSGRGRGAITAPPHVDSNLQAEAEQ